MKRWLFNGLAVISLLLCVAIAVLWARSQWMEDTIEIHHSKADGKEVTGAVLAFGSVSSTIGFGWRYIRMRAFEPTSPAETRWWMKKITQPPSVVPSWAEDRIVKGPNHWHEWHGFFLRYHYARDQSANNPLFAGDGYEWAIGLPHWLAFLFTAGLSSFASRKASWRRHRGAGLCANCGYDLRATPERCPECGAMAAVTKDVA